MKEAQHQWRRNTEINPLEAKKEEATLEVEDRRTPRDMTRLLVIIRWIVLAHIVDGNGSFLYSVV